MDPNAPPPAGGCRLAGVRAVIATLAGFPLGQAKAFELEAALGALGVSRRQARRWMRWASVEAGVVARAPKQAAGTIYSMPGCEPMGPEVPIAPPPPAPELENVAPMYRRDVALVILELATAGGTADKRELARTIAMAEGRPAHWARAVLDSAVAAAGLHVIGVSADVVTDPSAGRGSLVTTLKLKANIDLNALARWGAPVAFGLPSDPAALARHLRGKLGETLNLGDGEAEVAIAMAGLGGNAVAEELLGAISGREARAVVNALRDPSMRPAWVVADHGERWALAPALWGA